MEDELASLERQCASKRAHLERLEASLVGLESAWADERAELDERIRRNTARAAALRWEWCARAHSRNARDARAHASSSMCRASSAKPSGKTCAPT